MKQLRRAACRLRGVFRWRAIEREIEEELECHLQIHVDESLQRGMTIDQAREQALLFLGDTEAIKRQYRTEAIIPFLLHRVQDFLNSLADLRSHAIYTAVLILSLSSGIGIVTALLGVLHNVVIDPYPYADASGMYHLLVTDARGGLVWPFYTKDELQMVRSSGAVESAMGYRNEVLRYAGSAGVENVTATDLTPNAWSYLGVSPLLGSGLSQAGDHHSVVVLGYTFWSRHFHQDREILGKTIRLNHQPYKIAGVARRHFTWGGGDIFLPEDFSKTSSRNLEINLRLQHGFSIKDAQTVLGKLLNKFAASHPRQFPNRFSIHLTTLNEPFTPHSIPVLRLLAMGAVALCVVVFLNIYLLASSRIPAHRDHLQAFLSAGASLSRLFGYLVVEAALISLAGSTAAILVAIPLTSLLQNSLPAYSFPPESPQHLGLAAAGGGVVLGALCFVTLAAVGGLVCVGERSASSLALAFSKRELLDRLHFGFTIGQVALIIMLLFSSALSIQTYVRLIHKPLGYDAAHVLVANLSVSESKYLTWTARSAYLQKLLDAANNPDTKKQLAFASYATPPDDGLKITVTLSNKDLPLDQPVSAHFVSSLYFSILRVPLLKGKMWTSQADLEGRPVVIINETMRRLMFPSIDPIGQTIRLPKLSYLQYSLPGTANDAWLQIIGVVRDFRSDGLDRPIMPAVYLPVSILLTKDTQLLVRTQQRSAAAQAELIERFHTVDASQLLSTPLRPLASFAKEDPGRTRAEFLSVSSFSLALCAFFTATIGFISRCRLPLLKVCPRRHTHGLAPRLLGALRESAGAVLAGILVGLATIAVLTPDLERALLTQRHGLFVWNSVLLTAGITAGACIWNLLRRRGGFPGGCPKPGGTSA